ncbi:unannotated protein [freshwater metagenome]|uniref:Unannotated protein n=1 Tax=freshwater metagenome TaxID=449393 RepID=A0A6J7HV02_9ZZZZ|nr:molybdopterin-dependent oxidoreductase [Actinomycetota bacterium]
MTAETGIRRPYVGQSVLRSNDPKLLTGGGRFTDDLHFPGMLHATIVRSTLAHGTIDQFDAVEARAESDVALVLGPDEIASATGMLPCVWLAPDQRMTHIPIVSRKVTYVGQPIGIVVADSRAAAEDAVEILDITFAELPCVVDSEAAIAPGAPLLVPEWGNNICAQVDAGDPRDEIEEVIARAAHVVERRLRIQRVAPNPMETRAVVARWDAADESLTVWMSTQTPHHCRDHLATALGLRADQVRVIVGELGGGFGAKEHLYPDEVMVCLAAMRLDRPVKWVEDRVESLTATLHGRDAIHRARLALDANGKFLAIHSDILGNLGAHPSNVGLGPFRVSMGMLPGPYHFERAGGSLTAVLSNTTPTGAYRGFGMQEATWVRERLVDEAARELGLDVVELRVQNMIQPHELPFTTRTFQPYDSGDYPEGMRRTAVAARAEANVTSEGRIRRGLGFATHVEFTGLGDSRSQQIVGFSLGGYETAKVRVDPDGSVSVTSGVTNMGQGIDTGFAQLTADHLGIGIERVSVRLGDTASAPYSATGSIASRSMTVGGGAVVTAAGKVRNRMMAIAAHQLEISPDDLELVRDASGRDVFQPKGSPDIALTWEKVAESAWLNWNVPDEFNTIGLEETFVYNPVSVSYAYATHAVSVAVDLDTGLVKLEGYWVTHDVGVMVNPMICDGQVHGGIAQGVGIALYEGMRWGDTGQPTTTTYLDYVLPLSVDIPDVKIEHMVTPSPFIPGGMKGLGEGGTIGSPAAVGNAIAAAIPEIAGSLLETPFSPSKLWTMIDEAGLHV